MGYTLRSTCIDPYKGGEEANRPGIEFPPFLSMVPVYKTRRGRCPDSGSAHKNHCLAGRSHPRPREQEEHLPRSISQPSFRTPRQIIKCRVVLLARWMEKVKEVLPSQTGTACLLWPRVCFSLLTSRRFVHAGLYQEKAATIAAGAAWQDVPAGKNPQPAARRASRRSMRPNTSRSTSASGNRVTRKWSR